jgi:hypothetical protein
LGDDLTDISAFGASFDGVTDDTDAWIRAIAAAQASDCVVELPAGWSIVSERIRQPDDDPTALIISGAPLAIRGKGRGISGIRLASGTNAHVITFRNVTGGGLYDLTVDGNRGDQMFGHCVRCNWVLNFAIERVETVGAHHYGIGFQRGYFRDVTVRDVLIANVGGDGIDIKNPMNLNMGFLLENIRIRQHGQDGAAGNEAAIDARGPCIIRNIFVEDLGSTPSGQIGIRLRNGELGEVTGPGAHKSIVSGFQISGGTKDRTIAVNSVARNAIISDGYVENVMRAIQCQQEANVVSAVIARDCRDAFLASAGGVPTDGDNTTFIGCVATAAERGFRAARPHIEFASCTAYRCNTSFYADAEGTDMRVIGGKSSSPVNAHRGGSVANISAVGLLEV